MKKTSLLSRVTAPIVGATAIAGSIIAPFAAHAASALDNLAAGLNNTAGAATLSGGSTDIATVVGRFIAAALGLLGVILVCIFIYAGFLWMTAQGNEEKVKTAKKMISNAVIGMILIFAAYAITQFVISAMRSSLAA